MTSDEIIRTEQPDDAKAVRQVNQLAFKRPDDAMIVDALRASGALTLSLVAEVGGAVVGHIAFSPVTIDSDAGTVAAIGLAPMAVTPAHQRAGIGGRLVRAGLEMLKSRGHAAVVVLGHPAYYPRFGFERASRYGVRWEIECPDEAFMALELRPGALSGSKGGVARYRPEFGAAPTEGEAPNEDAAKPSAANTSSANTSTSASASASTTSSDDVPEAFKHLVADKAAAIARFNQLFCDGVPHNKALGMRIIDVAFGEVEIVLPYAPHLVGDPDSGVIHGGAITSFIDATCGASAFLKVLKPIPIATLDLRIDYMRRAEPGRDVIARAHCYHVTRNVAFVRGVAYHDDKDRPIASAAGTFMLQSHGKSLMPSGRGGASSKGDAS